MAQVYNSDSSPFYRSRFPQSPKLDKGNLGPPIFGPYQQRWDASKRQWKRPDGSRAPLAGLGNTGDMVLPTLDLSSGSAQMKLFDKQTFVVLAGALALGLGGGYALQHRAKLLGAGLIAAGGVAAVLGIIRLKQNADNIAMQKQWQDLPAVPEHPGMPGSGMVAGFRR